MAINLCRDLAALREQNANAVLLVDSGADVNARCEDGTDALMIAALNGDAQMADFLLSRGANHQTRVAKDSVLKGEILFEGVTTLMIAAGAGNMESVVALINAGADVNAASKKGTTALIAAAAQGHLEVAIILVENNADLYNLDTGRTALEAARYSGSPYIVDLIQEARKKLQEGDKE